MVLKDKTSDLLALLIAHAGAASPAVLVVPRPPTPALTRASSSDAVDKKRKKGQGGKGSEGAKEEEITHPLQQPLAKDPQTTRA